MAGDVKESADQARDAQPNGAKEAPRVAVKTRTELWGPEQTVSHEAPKGYDLLTWSG
jgi:hypothetical protein